MEDKSIKTLIVEDHPMMRKSIKLMLDGMKMPIVYDEACDGLEASILIKEKFYDLVLLDLRLPKLRGTDVAKIIVEEHPKTKILVVSDYDVEQEVAMLMNLGVVGYLMKSDADDDTLLMAIKLILDGNKYFSKGIVNIWDDFLENKSKGKVTRDVKEIITSRERDIIRYVCLGNTSEQIAAKLFIEVSTVKTHRNNIMKKINGKSVIDLFIYAVQHHIINLKDDFGISEYN
ncbi:MAG: response regulator transcription factor [Bacteroidota bacterium]